MHHGRQQRSPAPLPGEPANSYCRQHHPSTKRYMMIGLPHVGYSFESSSSFPLDRGATPRLSLRPSGRAAGREGANSIWPMDTVFPFWGVFLLSQNSSSPVRLWMFGASFSRAYRLSLCHAVQDGSLIPALRPLSSYCQFHEGHDRLLVKILIIVVIVLIDSSLGDLYPAGLLQDCIT